MKLKPIHPKYIIKQNDTLDIITRKFGIEENIWKQYHNNNCSFSDIIHEDIPIHLEKIFLLPSLWDRELILNRPNFSEEKEKCDSHFITLAYQNTLYLKNIIQEQAQGVKITIQNHTKIESIKYIIALKWLGKTDDFFEVEVKQPQSLYINNKEADLKVDQLAVNTYKKIFPIIFQINRNGKIIGISNFKEIEQRWKNSIEEIKKYRFGEALDKYLRLCSYSLKDERILLQKLEQNYFIFSYFLGIYQTYEKQCTLIQNIHLPFSQDYDSIPIIANSRIDKQIDRYGMVKVVIDGETSEYDSKYYAKYFIDSKTHFINAMISRINIETTKEIIIKITNIP